jgi:hypothetical protein
MRVAQQADNGFLGWHTMRKGQRCRAMRHLTAHQGFVKAQTTGTIEFETRSLDRQLISVQWDGSFQMYVFPDEIELVDSLELERADGETSPARQFRVPE